MASEAYDLKNSIQAEAKNLGFCLVGFTSMEYVQVTPRFNQWLEKGHHAGMAYLADKINVASRYAPEMLLPGCKTIISLAAKFPNPLNYDNDRIPPTAGIIASYALGSDYHEVIATLHQKLIQFVTTETSEKFRWKSAVDANPLPEREIAVAAGLGWIAKNGMLTNPEYGSALFLSEILIDFEIPPDQPFTKDYCGSCTKCMAACPTQCIQSDRSIDANHCLSYLTIEHRGDIPKRYHQLLGERLFGCDTCIAVCPWNKKSKNEPQIASLFPQKMTNQFDLRENMLPITTAFHRFFTHSAVRRAGKFGFLRNSLIRLSNANSPNASELMETITEHFPDPRIIQLKNELQSRINKSDNKSEPKGFENPMSLPFDD